MIDADLLAANHRARVLDRAYHEISDVRTHSRTDDDVLMSLRVDLGELRNDMLQRAATMLMAFGKPGGHRSQHDRHCHMHYCTCGPAIKEANGGCDRLPGCGWPSAGGDGR